MTPSTKLLVVDDHGDTLFALRSALGPLGHPIITAANGDAALKAALRGDVAVAVVDVRIPGVSGLGVVRYLSRLPQTRSIPVILITGLAPDPRLVAHALELGVADLISKPVDPWALRIKVQYLYQGAPQPVQHSPSRSPAPTPVSPEQPAAASGLISAIVAAVEAADDQHIGRLLSQLATVADREDLMELRQQLEETAPGHASA